MNVRLKSKGLPLGAVFEEVVVSLFATISEAPASARAEGAP